MPKLKIITEGNPILRKKAKVIKKVEIPKVKKLIPSLIKVMKESDGIGIAAPQVGKSIRLVIINLKDGPLALVNPKITSSSWRKDTMEEGCLSVPRVLGQVKRSTKISVKSWGKEGKEIKFKAEGLFARVIQHEIDHINGILFIDKAIKITKKDNSKISVL